MGSSSAPAGPELDELEGWKDIGQALGVSEDAAKRYGRAGTATRLPLPTYHNWRGRRAQRLAVLAAWKAGGSFERPREAATA